VVSHNSSSYFKWNTRFIAIALPRNNTGNSAVDGHYNIEIPPVDTVIHGIGSLDDRSVTADGILLSYWETLYYKLPQNTTSTSVDGNFYISKHSETDTTLDNNYVMIATANGDTQSGLAIKLGNGMQIKSKIGSISPDIYRGASGRFTKSGDDFSVAKNSIIAINSKRYDSHGIFSINSNKIKVSVSGGYLISITGRVRINDYACRMQLIVGGNVISTWGMKSKYTWSRYASTVVVHINAGEEISYKAINNAIKLRGGTSLNISIVKMY